MEGPSYQGHKILSLLTHQKALEESIIIHFVNIYVCDMLIVTAHVCFNFVRHSG